MKSKEAIQKQLQDLNRMIENTMNEAMTNPEEQRELLEVMERFPRYSFRNTMILWKHNAILVKSFKQWKDDGYTVKKGSKAIKILAPYSLQEAFDQDGKSRGLYRDLTPEEKEKVKTKEWTLKPKVIGYKPIPVFDIRQTTVPIEKYPKAFQKAYLLDAMSDHDFNLLKQALDQLSKSEGIEQIPDETLDFKDFKGIYQHNDRDLKRMGIDQNLPKADFIFTYLHELTHHFLHGHQKPFENFPKGQREYQAEMTAGIVTSFLGLKSDRVTSAYIQQHSPFLVDLETSQKVKLMSGITETSQRLIHYLDETLREKEIQPKENSIIDKFLSLDLDNDGVMDLLDADFKDSNVQSIGQLDEREKGRSSLRERLDEKKDAKENFMNREFSKEKRKEHSEMTR